MKSQPARDPGLLIYGLIACFVAGGLVDWWVRSHVLVQPSAPDAVTLSELPRPRISSQGAAPDELPRRLVGRLADRSDMEEPFTATSRDTTSADAETELKRRALRLPIDAALVEGMRGQFDERRGGHTHEAVDLMAPRNAPIHAVEDGTVARLFISKAGGTTIYQFDPDERFCYYYAHLSGYAEGLQEGQRVSKGDVIGYVGTTGNAPPDAPHLHFAIFELTAAKKWWQGRAIDPFAVFSTGN